MENWNQVRPVYPPRDILVEVQLATGRVTTARWGYHYSTLCWKKPNNVDCFSMADPEVVAWRYIKKT